MIRILPFLALCLIASVDGQLGATGGAGPTYGPYGSTQVFDSPILSSASNAGILWLLVGSTRYATGVNVQTGGSFTVDLNAGAPSSAAPVVATQLKAISHATYGNVLYFFDEANQWITIYSLGEGIGGAPGFITSIDLHGFSSFDMSAGGRFLTVGTASGSGNLAGFDTYDMNAGELLYHRSLNDSKPNTFKINYSSYTQVGEIVSTLGHNNSLQTFRLQDGYVLRTQALDLPHFEVQASAVTVANDFKRYAYVDCGRAEVIFRAGDGSSSSYVSYPLHHFDSSQCSQSVVAIDDQSFAVLDGPNRMVYFGVLTPSSSAGPAPSSTGPSGPTFQPTGSTVFGTSIRSASGSVGVFWTITNSSSHATGIDLITGQTQTVDLNFNAPSGSLPVVASQLVALFHGQYGYVLYFYDSANQCITLYGLGNNGMYIGFIRSFPFTGFRSFALLRSGQFLGVAYGSEYIDYIDVYNIWSSVQSQYRITLQGSQATSFLYLRDQNQFEYVAVIIPSLTSMPLYGLLNGQLASSMSNIVGTQTAAVLYYPWTGIPQYAFMDCQQARVTFVGPYETTSFTMSRFNKTSQCAHSVVAVGNMTFAVLDGPNRVTYFQLPPTSSSSSTASPLPSSTADPSTVSPFGSSTADASTPAPVDPSTAPWSTAGNSSSVDASTALALDVEHVSAASSSLSPVAIAFILVGIVAFLALGVSAGFVYKARSARESDELSAKPLISV